jgi:hypothetical protein
VLEPYPFTKAKQEAVKSKLDEKVKELTEEYVRASYVFISSDHDTEMCLFEHVVARYHERGWHSGGCGDLYES